MSRALGIGFVGGLASASAGLAVKASPAVAAFAMALGAAGVPDAPSMLSAMIGPDSIWSNAALVLAGGAIFGVLSALLIFGANRETSMAGAITALTLMAPMLAIAALSGWPVVWMLTMSLWVFTAFGRLAASPGAAAIIGLGGALLVAPLLSSFFWLLFPGLFLITLFLAPSRDPIIGANGRALAGYLLAVWSPLIMASASLGFIFWLTGSSLKTGALPDINSVSIAPKEIFAFLLGTPYFLFILIAPSAQLRVRLSAVTMLIACASAAFFNAMLGGTLAIILPLQFAAQVGLLAARASAAGRTPPMGWSAIVTIGFAAAVFASATGLFERI